MDENLQNGISKINIKQPPILARHLNGLGSTSSSRDPSPTTRYQQIPSAQLPPSSTGILASQVPLTRPLNTNINQLTQDYVSGLNTTNLVSVSSPKVQLFGTSTHIIEKKEKETTDRDSNASMIIKKSVLSPTTNAYTPKSEQTLENKEQIVSPRHMHSPTSQFTTVTSNTLSDSNNVLMSDKKNVSMSKFDEGAERTFDFNLFTNNSMRPIVLHGKSLEQLNSGITRNAVLQLPSQSQITKSSNQNLMQNAHHFTNAEQSQTLQGNFQQKPIAVNQNIFQSESSQVSQKINNQPLNFANQHNHMILKHKPQSVLYQTGAMQNIPQNQFNSLKKPSMESNLSQPQLDKFNKPPLMDIQQKPQMLPNSLQNQYVHFQDHESVTTFPRSKVLGGSQIQPQFSLQNTNQNVPPSIIPQVNNQNLPQLNQNLPQISSQNQSRMYLHSNRYPQVSSQSTELLQQQPMQQFQYSNTQQTPPTYPYQTRPSVTQSGFDKLWGRENYDLLQSPNILPRTKLEPPKISLGQDFLDAVNCNPEIFRCTMTKIPETTSLLQKSRLPLGVLIHPFKDLNHLPVIQCNTIVRCRACRTYINPFVFFADSKRWKCNLCYRINDLPDEFQFDPVTKTYGDPSRRPEVKSSTIEYIAPAEYMLRPPQPAVYLFLMDVSRLAIETGYLHTICNILSSELMNLPGDARTQIGILTYDSSLHFYALSEGQNQPHEMTVLDIEDVFLPCPDNLLVNLQDRMDMISDLLTQLPTRYLNTFESNSALGAALQAGYKMMAATGGRITVFQASLPNIGPGALTSREDPNQRASSDVAHLNPANDFYKRLALECSGQQIAVDLFILNTQYVDLATISGISRFSGGCIYHFPLFKASKTLHHEALERSFRRYITRKIGFEAVMRIRCTRGLSIHTFHGNFFVRSTDLLSLPNINPDAGFGMQVSIEENLTDVQTVCFQAALLYTSSRGERRIRVHTMCLPVANNLTDVINAADQQCVIGLLSKMAVDRSMQSSLSDAREAFLNVAVDILSSYKLSLNMGSSVSGLMAPECLKLLPLYISALLKNIAFRIGISTRLDDRVKSMCDMKTKPLPYLMQLVYPDLYPIHNLEEHSVVVNEDDEAIHQPPHLQLTARSLDSNGAYLLDTGEHIMIFVCANVSSTFLNNVLDISDFSSISDEFYELPLLENQHNKRLHSFINYLNDDKPFQATLQVIRENSPNRILFYERLIEDRLENSLSYHEFLQHIKTQIK